MMTPVYASIRVLLIGLPLTLLFETSNYKSYYYCHYYYHSHFLIDISEPYAILHTL
jgi:hypothetical protein